MKAKHYTLIFAVAVLVRFLYSGIETIPWPDAQAFLQSAWALVEGHWQDFRAERTPGYPLFLILNLGLLRLTGSPPAPELLVNTSIWFQSFLGCATAVLVAAITQRLFSRQWLSLCAGMLCALSPDLILYEHYILSESLYAFLLALYVGVTVWQWEKSDSITRGLLLGLLAIALVWTRHIAIVVFAASAVVFWLRRQQKTLVTYGALVFLSIGGWSMFQYNAHGFFGFSAGSGLNQLYKAVSFVNFNTPLEADFKAALKERIPLHPQQRQYEAVNDAHVLHAMANEKSERPKPYDEIYLEDDRSAAAIVREAVIGNPLKYLASTLKQFQDLVIPGTEADPHALYWGPLCLLAALALVFLCAENFTALSLIGIITAGQLLLYPWLTVCVPRYRIPLEPLVIILAAYALLRLSSQTHLEKAPAP